MEGGGEGGAHAVQRLGARDAPRGGGESEDGPGVVATGQGEVMTFVDGPRRFLGFTWIGWLNFLLLQWFGVRLMWWFMRADDKRIGLLFPVVPLTGWWTDFRPRDPRRWWT